MSDLLASACHAGGSGSAAWLCSALALLCSGFVSHSPLLQVALELADVAAPGLGERRERAVVVGRAAADDGVEEGGRRRVRVGQRRQEAALRGRVDAVVSCELSTKRRTYDEAWFMLGGESCAFWRCNAGERDRENERET